MNKYKSFGILCLLMVQFFLQAQDKLEIKGLKIFGDFRYRIEQDWDSRKANGSFREDRTRMRYRARLGFRYQYKDVGLVGMQLRTGIPGKQQDPQLTVGDKANGQGTVPVGLDKFYFQTNFWGFETWMGKNSFPFEKQNDLFWSNNVCPEGIFLKRPISTNEDYVQDVELRMGHFIIENNNDALSEDGYFQAIQFSGNLLDKRLRLFPSLYYFKNLPNIPDGAKVFYMEYSIFHLGAKYVISKADKLSFQADFYRNLTTYSDQNFMAEGYKNGRTGTSLALKYGDLMEKGDFTIKCVFTYMEKYAAVDFLAQNDWGRWDYGSDGSPDGRLTNFRGVELMAGYAIDEKLLLKLRMFRIKQLVAIDGEQETGSRLRLDLDFKF